MRGCAVALQVRRESDAPIARLDVEGETGRIVAEARFACCKRPLPEGNDRDLNSGAVRRHERVLPLRVVFRAKGEVPAVDHHLVALGQCIALPVKQHDQFLSRMTGLIREAGADPPERHAFSIDDDLDPGAIETGERHLHALSFLLSAGASIVDLAVVEVVDVFGDPAIVHEVMLAFRSLPLGEDDPDEPVWMEGASTDMTSTASYVG